MVKDRFLEWIDIQIKTINEKREDKDITNEQLYLSQGERHGLMKAKGKHLEFQLAGSLELLVSRKELLDEKGIL